MLQNMYTIIENNEKFVKDVFEVYGEYMLGRIIMLQDVMGNKYRCLITDDNPFVISETLYGDVIVTDKLKPEIDLNQLSIHI